MKIKCIGFVLFAVVHAAAAVGEPWAEFKNRCLAPFLNGTDPDISKLVPVPNAAVTGETIDIVQPADGSFVMSSFNPGQYKDFSCAIQLPIGSSLDWGEAGLASWTDSVTAEGTFKTDRSDDYDYVVSSINHELGIFTIRALLGDRRIGPTISIGKR